MALGRRFDGRESERFEVDGDVTLRVYLTRTDDVCEVHATLVNAGMGGLLIRTDAASGELPVGALADLEIQLDGAPLQHVLGLVRWVDDGRKDAGIEFFYSTDEERDALEYSLRDWHRRHAPRSRCVEH